MYRTALILVCGVLCGSHAWGSSMRYPNIGGPFNSGPHSMDDNCILSFVVPRDMMKSNCQLDSKVQRRLNTQEMKVNIYQQQVDSMQQQVDKQRMMDTQRLDRLEQQMKTSTTTINMSHMLERRLALLEKEFSILQHDINMPGGDRAGRAAAAAAAASRAGRTGTDGGSSARTIPGKTPDDLNMFVENPHNPSALPGVVRNLVKMEVKAALDNVTEDFKRYVRDQIILFNQVFNLMPRRSDVMTVMSGRTTGSAEVDGRGGGQGSKGRRADRSDASDRSGVTNEEMDRMKDRLSSAGEKIARHVGKFMKDKTAATASLDSKPRLSHKESLEIESIFAQNESEILNEDLLDTTNFSYSGDNQDGQQDHAAAQEPFTSLEREVSKGATSRISNPSETENATSEDGEDRSYWEQNMIRDQQQDHRSEMESRLKNEITSMLYTSLAEIMTRMKKHKVSIEQRIKDHEENAGKLTSDFRGQFRGLDKSIQTMEMQVESLSQGFQDYSSMMNNIRPLEPKIAEIVNHFNNKDPSRQESLESLDEQSKKVRKMERLLGVYQQSLEHYKNDTKQEYRELMEIITKGTDTRMSDGLKADLTSSMTSTITSLNNTFMSEIQQIKENYRHAEDSTLLLQLDFASAERQIESIRKRTDRKVNDLEEQTKQLSSRQRDFRKRFDSMEQVHQQLGMALNTTANDVFKVKTELKLNVLDEWLPMNFEYDSSRTECFGKQYVRRSMYEDASLVGVILCSPTRYKIFLATSLHSTFLNIGDGNGMGEDHCEFVRARSDSHVRLSQFKPSYQAVQGFTRNHWGQKPFTSYLNTIKPSPYWYECGVSIP